MDLRDVSYADFNPYDESPAQSNPTALAQSPHVISGTAGHTLRELPRVPDVSEIGRLLPLDQPMVPKDAAYFSTPVGDLVEGFQGSENPSPTPTRDTFQAPLDAADPFWGDRFDVLFDKRRLTECFPLADQTIQEKLNALSRLILYVGVGIAVYQKKTAPLHYAFFLLAIIYMMWRSQSIVHDGGTKETFMGENCTLPTLNNPFMNRMATDDARRPPACSGPGIQEMASNLLDKQLFADVDDLYSRNANQRMFVTTPSTQSPDDRENFSNWLFKGNSSGKNPPMLNDLRRQRSLIPEDLELPNVTGYNM